MAVWRERLARLLIEAPPDAPALHSEGVWRTWGELAAFATALDDLLGSGAAGERVGVIVRNRAEHVAAIAAILARGRTLVTFNPLQPPERLRADLDAVRPGVLLGAGADLRAASIDGAEGRLVVAVDGFAMRPAGRIGRAGPAPDESDVAVEMLTSGTTGPPKRVNLGWKQLDAALQPSGRVDDATLLSSGVLLVATPIVHIGGLWAVLAGFRAGRRIALLERFEVASWVAAIEELRPVTCGLVPAAMRSVLDAGVPAHRLASLRAVTTGTQACPVELAERFTATYGIPVLSTYGATEFAGAVAGWTARMHREWWERKRGAAGRAFPGCELRVVDPTSGDQLPAGARGVLEVRSRQMPDAGAGWIRTSDFARVDEDGFLFVDGRLDDVIVRGGFKIEPRTVQAALERHPSVVEACVCGAPEQRLGAVPVAGVEVRPDLPTPTADELLAFVRAQLLPYEVPTRLVILPALPRTPSQKVSRPDLMALIDGTGALS
jgi:acyl-CoA synthetase (AMP-forming)/AMP-acid ligase II